MPATQMLKFTLKSYVGMSRYEGTPADQFNQICSTLPSFPTTLHAQIGKSKG
jgi:hypothetical protein